ncbi:MAG: hypothetical protein EPN22_02220 [Nitrospirae bacterium]|nr:MAG: hypothetical protein EPN22_02220 [Nitrospirota bacterium]
MGKKQFKKQINSLKEQISEHELKITAELQKKSPNDKLISHWRREIEAFNEGIIKAQKRLRRTR